MSVAEIESRVIKTDDDAWLALTQAMADEIGDTVNIVFEGWPVFKITLEGEDFNATIPTRIMPPILELQKEIHRIYCRAKYNDESTRRLSDEDRKQLELVVHVKPGSSKYVTHLADVLNEVVKNSNMTGDQVVILLVGIAAIIGSGFAWKNWLQKREREHQLDTSVKLSEQETERMAILAQAMNREPQLYKTQHAIDDVRSQFSKKMQPKDRLIIGVEPIVDGTRAAEIAYSARQHSEDTRIDGEFVINEVKFPKTYGEDYRFNITRIADNKTLTANVSPTKLSDQQLKILKDGGFGIKRMFMAINAKETRGHISHANLVSIEWPATNTEET